MSTVLIVDDMAICREPIADALRRHGYDCITAADGSEALSLVREQRPGLILLDVLMPGLDGFAVLRTLRRNPDFEGIPVIMLTEKAEKEFVLRAAEQRVQGYLLKSQFSLDELLWRVKQGLEATDGGTTARKHQQTEENVLEGGSGPHSSREDATSCRADVDPCEDAKPQGRPVPAGSVGSSAPHEVATVGSSAVSAPRGTFARWRAQDGAAAQAAEVRDEEPRVSAPVESARPEGRSIANARQSAAQDPPPPGRILDELRPLITKDDLIRLVNHGLDLRPLGPAIHNVITVTANPRCSAEEVARAVAHDQALCIRVLKLANSSAYSRGRMVESVREAVQRLGIHEVRSLVMALGVFQEFEGAAARRVDPRLFWEHSLACGLLASGIAKARGAKDIDDHFLWGMLHDVGRLVLLEHVSEQYAQVWDVATKYHLPLESVEAKMMLLDHCDILARALERWAFPRQFITPVVSHHHTVERIKRLGPEYSDAAMTIALADRLAHALLIGSSGNDAIYPLDELIAGLRMPAGKLQEIISNTAGEAEDLKLTILARGSESAWPDYASRLRRGALADVRALHASAEPKANVFEMFFQRLRDEGSEEPPNVGILYVRNAAEFPVVKAEYEQSKRRLNAPDLPLVVIHDKGKIDSDDPWLRERPHTTLRAPVRVSRLQEAIEGLFRTQPVS